MVICVCASIALMYAQVGREGIVLLGKKPGAWLVISFVPHVEYSCNHHGAILATGNFSSNCGGQELNVAPAVW